MLPGPALQQQVCETMWLDPNNCVLLSTEQVLANLSDEERETLRSLLRKALERPVA